MMSSEKPSLKEQLTFMAGFISDVRSDIQTAQTNAVQQTGAAKTAETAKQNTAPQKP